MVEVGVGGREDATNILPAGGVSVIAKVDLDHQALLGDTLEAVASQKAGIIKPAARVVVDGSNTASVCKIIADCAESVGAKPPRFVTPQGRGPTVVDSRWGELKVEKHLPGGFQAGNVAVAVAVAEELVEWYPGITGEGVVRAIAETRWPGRLEMVDVGPLGVGGRVLVDGAHNEAAAKALREYVDEKFPGGVDWVLAFSRGKEVEEMMRVLVREGERVVGCGFGEVEGMPWVRCVEPEEIVKGKEGFAVERVEEAVKTAVGWERQVVVAGSLYLGGELAQALEKAGRV